MVRSRLEHRNEKAGFTQTTRHDQSTRELWVPGFDPQAISETPAVGGATRQVSIQTGGVVRKLRL